MTWTVLIVTILVSILKILATCLPTGVVEWLLNKFGTHKKLNAENVSITIDEKLFDSDETVQLIKDFNEATLLEKHYIWPGNEKLFLNPESNKSPLVINTKIGKMDISFYVYIYSDHVYVVKQYKKKVEAYSLISNTLQERFTSSTGPLQEINHVLNSGQGVVKS